MTALVARKAEGRTGVQFSKTANDTYKDAMANFGTREEKVPINRILKMIIS